jgi:hypothetical protein
MPVVEVENIKVVLRRVQLPVLCIGRNSTLWRKISTARREHLKIILGLIHILT